ncbi:MAG: tetratricopeptide repeat protein [Anaerolineae bacterium]|nr:tetratricopeptide repeat protein [Anaerolineae bacterium]
MDGDAVDLRSSQGAVVKPQGPVTQHFHYSFSSIFGTTLGNFIVQNWKLLLTLVLINGALLLLSPIVQAHYLIKPIAVIGIAVLVTLTILGWVGLAHQHWHGKVLWYGAITITVLLSGALGWQVKQILWPQQFAPQTFGIAVAYFGEGPELDLTQRGKQITLDLIERLTSEAQKRDMADQIEVKHIGIVASSTQARKEGQRIGADLVIWGRLVVGEEGAVTVHFEVIETPASALNPDLPRILPIGYAYSATATDYTTDIRGVHHFEIKEAIAEQSNAATFFVLGLALHLDRQFQDAISLLEEAKAVLETENAAVVSESVADIGLVYYYLGKSYQKLGHFEKAAVELEAATQLNPRDPAAQIDLAYCYRSLGRSPEAEQALRKAVALCKDILSSAPANREALYDLGIAYRVLEEEENALDTYLRLIEAHPDFHIAYIGAGVIYAQQEDFEAAIQMYTQALEEAEKADYNGVAAHIGLGDVYLKQGETEPALDEYRLAIQLEPGYDWSHFRLAQGYEARGDVDLAWEEYEKLIAVSDNQIWAYSVMGDFLQAQRLYDLALENYNHARRLNPDNATVYLRLGEIYLDKYLSADGKVQDAQQAEQAFTEALAHLPEYLPMRFYILAARGRLYFAQGRFDLAIEDFEEALAQSPLSPEIQFSLARAYEASGDIPLACAAFEKVLEPEMQALEELRTYAEERLQTVCDH